jgi:hypothetical protein
VNDCLQILYRSGEDKPPSIEDKGALLETARAALTDHLWEKR